MKKIYRVLPLILVVLLFSCNKKINMNIEEMPLPAGATSGSIDGAYEVALDNATNSILKNFKESYPQTREKILFLPSDVKAAHVFELYDSKLVEKGYVKNASIPLEGKNYQLVQWDSAGGLFGGGGQAVAVAVIDAGTDAGGKAIKFLAVYTGEK